MRSDEPWRCGGSFCPGMSRMIRTFDCRPSRSGCATTCSLSYPGASLTLIMSTPAASRSPARQFHDFPRFDAPRALSVVTGPHAGCILVPCGRSSACPSRRSAWMSRLAARPAPTSCGPTEDTSSGRRKNDFSLTLTTRTTSWTAFVSTGSAGAIAGDQAGVDEARPHLRRTVRLRKHDGRWSGDLRVNVFQDYK